jgi:hypothetical protein
MYAIGCLHVGVCVCGGGTSHRITSLLPELLEVLEDVGFDLPLPDVPIAHEAVVPSIDEDELTSDERVVFADEERQELCHLIGGAGDARVERDGAHFIHRLSALGSREEWRLHVCRSNVNREDELRVCRRGERAGQRGEHYR